MYTIRWCDKNHNIHSCKRNNLIAAQKLADKLNGHVYDENDISIYPEEKPQLTYSDLRVINDLFIRYAGPALEAAV